MTTLKQWNIGNTTVRNPLRIPDALRAVERIIDGAENTRDLQAKIWTTLVAAGVVDSETAGGGDWGGRKWIHAFVQLGLIRREPVTKTRDRLFLTDVGKALLSGAEPSDELYLRQLLKYHLPSTVEDKPSSFEGFDLHPIRFFIAILWELNKRGEPGLTKEEIALFVVNKTRNDELATTVDAIIAYRQALADVKGNVAKRNHYERARLVLGQRLYADEIRTRSALLTRIATARKKGAAWSSSVLRELVDQVVRTQRGAATGPSAALAADLKALIDKGDVVNARRRLAEHIALRTTGTMKDYADTLVRYSSLSELFSVHGRRIALQTTSKLPVLQVIVAEGFPAFNEGTYSADYWNPRVPRLPTEETEVVRAQVDNLIEVARAQAKELGTSFVAPAPAISRGELVATRAELETNVIRLKVESWARRLSDEAQLAHILQIYEDIRSRNLVSVAYRPAFQEWNWWRLILAFDALAVPADRTRNFPIDAELNPTHNAKPGVADMVFTYSDWILVVEVTLNTTARQWAAEGEPVPRHVADVVAAAGDKPVIALFLAPVIDLNTAQTFFTQLHSGYVMGKKLVPLRIIPVSEEDAIGLISVLKRGDFTTSNLRRLLEDSVKAADGCRDGIEWLEAIRKLWRTSVRAEAAA